MTAQLTFHVSPMTYLAYFLIFQGFLNLLKQGLQSAVEMSRPPPSILHGFHLPELQLLRGVIIKGDGV